MNTVGQALQSEAPLNEVERRREMEHWKEQEQRLAALQLAIQLGKVESASELVERAAGILAFIRGM